jgi:hypothetical protein
MPAGGESSSEIRGAIDAVLERARSEWDGPGLDRVSVVLVATLDDVCVRIRATTDVATERAKALLEDGWSIEFRDRPDASLRWSPTEGLAPARRRGPDAVEPPTIAEEDLPPPPTAAIDRLRDTA